MQATNCHNEYDENSPKLINPIRNVLQQVHPGMSMNKATMRGLNLLLNYLGNKAGAFAAELDCNIVRPSSAIEAFCSMTRGEITRHAKSEMVKAMTKYVNSSSSAPPPKSKGRFQRRCRLSRAQRAGLQFAPVKMRVFFPGRVNKVAEVVFAAGMEYVCAEILELSGNAARDSKKLRITPRHIFLAIAYDSELCDMFFVNNFLVLPNASVVPCICPQRIRRNNPSITQALREIRRQQKSTEQVLPNQSAFAILEYVWEDILDGPSSAWSRKVVEMIAWYIECVTTEILTKACKRVQDDTNVQEVRDAILLSPFVLSSKVNLAIASEVIELKKLTTRNIIYKAGFTNPNLGPFVNVIATASVIPLLEEAMKIGEDRQIRVSDTIIRQAAANLNIIMAI